MLALTLAYAEVLRRYGAPGLVDAAPRRPASWAGQPAGAPRPMEALLGVPALVWGIHMRPGAVRAGGSAPSASPRQRRSPRTCSTPASTVQEAGLATLYGLVIGLVIGFVVIRADLLLTGSRGRRARTDEAASALRPEPPRTWPLL